MFIELCKLYYKQVISLSNDLNKKIIFALYLHLMTYKQLVVFELTKLHEHPSTVGSTHLSQEMSMDNYQIYCKINQTSTVLICLCVSVLYMYGRFHSLISKKVSYKMANLL